MNVSPIGTPGIGSVGAVSPSTKTTGAESAGFTIRSELTIRPF